MPDTATALAGLRAGKIDALDNLDNTTASNLHKTNPELLKTPVYGYAGNDLDINNSIAPLSDVKVRQALQMAINLPELDNTLYDGLVDPSPLALTSSLLYPAYGWPYSQWPQELKDEYAFNLTAAKALLTAAGKPNGFHVAVLDDNTADRTCLKQSRVTLLLLTLLWISRGRTMPPSSVRLFHIKIQEWLTKHQVQWVWAIHRYFRFRTSKRTCYLTGRW